MSKLEKEDERRFSRMVEQMGLLQLKLNVSGKRGWPDRLILGWNGLAILFEFKRPDGTGEVRPLQKFIHEAIKTRGHKVYVVETKEEALKILKAEIRKAKVSSTRH